jgi:hypothetical protein
MPLSIVERGWQASDHVQQASSAVLDLSYGRVLLLYLGRSHNLECYTDRGRESDETSVLATDQGSGGTLINFF